MAMVLFFGYLNYGNFGDNLLLELASSSHKEHKVLSSKNSLIEHFKLISRAKKIILLGGIFQDTTSLHSSLYYFLVILFAKFLGKRITSLATGIGPLRSRMTREITKLSYTMMDEISVRDEYSSQFLTGANIEHKLVPDLAWSLEYDESKVDKSKMPQGSFAIISINPYLEKINTKDKLEIICEAKQKPSAENFIHTKDFNAHELIYLFKNHCHSFLTQRFHLAILASKAGIEFQTTDDCHKVNCLLPPRGSEQTVKTV